VPSAARTAVTEKNWYHELKNKNELDTTYYPYGAGIIFFLILAHTVYKMWIIQEHNTLELWNKLHFEEKKNAEYIPCLKYAVPTFVE